MKAALEGRVAIVTGGARGIGLAIARALVGHGARAVIADNGASIDGRTAEAGVAARAVAPLGDRAIPYAAGITSGQTAVEAVMLAVEAFGGLDIVVNNAAIVRDAFIFKSRSADFEEVIAVNLSAAHHLLSAATPVFRSQAKSGVRGDPYAWGRIVNVTSTAGLYGNYGQSAYASSKAALVGLTRVAALDMARSGVTCNAVAPFAATRVTESIVPANEAQQAYKNFALTVPAEAVGEFVVYLCSERAATVTGQVFGVRGRELFLFSQPRPVARAESEGAAWRQDEIGERMAEFVPSFAPLETDLEAFAPPQSRVGE